MVSYSLGSNICASWAPNGMIHVFTRKSEGNITYVSLTST